MSSKALLNREAILELERNKVIEVEVTIQWKKQMFRMVSVDEVQPDSQSSQSQQSQQSQQTQQQEIINNNGQKLQPADQINYPWKVKQSLWNQKANNTPFTQPVRWIRADNNHSWGWLDADADEDFEWFLSKRASLNMDDQDAVNEIRRILRDNLYERRILDKRWRLETNRLAHYRTSNRLFSRKTLNQWKKYHFEILLDVSWSMFDYYRMMPSLKATHAVVKTLNKLWDVRVTLFGDTSVTLTAEQFEDIASYVISTGDASKIRDKVEAHYVTIHDMNNKKIVTLSYSEWKQLYCWKGGGMLPWYKAIDYWKMKDWTFEWWPVLSSLNYLRKQDWEKCLIVIHDWDSKDVWVRIKRFVITGWYQAIISWNDVSNYDHYSYPQKIREASNEWIHIQSIAIWTDWPRKDYAWLTKNIKTPQEVYPLLVWSIRKMISDK